MNRAHHLVFLGFAILLAAGAAPAPAAKPALNQKCDILLDADKIDANVLAGKGGVATGNVVVTQCDMKMHADAVRVTTVNGQYDKVVATGKVVLISQKSGVATGDNGVYEVAQKLVTMTGHVVLKNGPNVMSGTHLTYNTVTGLAHLDSGPSATAASAGPGSAPTGRVHAVLTPQSESGAK